MKIILINHAERQRDPDRLRDREIDRDQPLTAEGVAQAHDVANRLRANGGTPTLYLTSRNAHAKQTAEIVCSDLGGTPSTDVVEIDALTPRDPTETCGQILEQAKASGHDPQLHDVVAIIGHYPRLNQLFAYLTWQTAAPTPLGYAEEVYVTVKEKFCDGTGQGQWPSSSSR
jgi:phosphohistidine phosphatase SixA